MLDSWAATLVQNAGNDSKEKWTVRWFPAGTVAFQRDVCHWYGFTLISFSSQMFTVVSWEDFPPQCDKFSNFVMEARRKWNSLYRNPFCSQISWDSCIPESNSPHPVEAAEVFRADDLLPELVGDLTARPWVGGCSEGHPLLAALSSVSQAVISWGSRQDMGWRSRESLQHPKVAGQ